MSPIIKTVYSYSKYALTCCLLSQICPRIFALQLTANFETETAYLRTSLVLYARILELYSKGGRSRPCSLSEKGLLVLDVFCTHENTKNTQARPSERACMKHPWGGGESGSSLALSPTRPTPAKMGRGIYQDFGQVPPLRKPTWSGLTLFPPTTYQCIPGREAVSLRRVCVFRSGFFGLLRGTGLPATLVAFESP